MSAPSNTPTNFDPSLSREIGTSYDHVPYVSSSYPKSHPSHVKGVAALFGLTAPSPQTARVLEIGCAGGGNLIPIAATYPQSRCLGIDLSAVQVAQGQRRIERAGLRNIEIRRQNILDFPTDAGAFDYIIVHGIYSWIPDPVRDALLHLIARHLAPDGVAYVSFNTLPGWRPKQIIRDALMPIVQDVPDLAARLGTAKSMLTFLRDEARPTSYGTAMRETAAQLLEMDDAYLAHEFLELENTAFTFRDFAKRIMGAGLAYLAECDVATMVPENYGATAAQQIRAISQSDLIQCEQAMDVISGRTLRQTLLVPAGRQNAINRGVTEDRLNALHLLGRLTEREAQPDFAHCFQDASGAVLRTNHAGVGQALEILQRAAPATRNLADLAHEADLPDRRALAILLMQGIMAGIITFSSEPVRIGAKTVACPRALALARADAENGASIAVNLHGENIPLDLIARHLLPLLDGSNDRPTLLNAILAQAAAGQILFMRQNQRIEEAEDIRATAQEHIDRALDMLWRNAFLIPLTSRRPDPGRRR